MSKSIKELAEELFQYFEEGNEQGIVLLLNNCNRDKRLDKVHYNSQLNSQGILPVDSEHFSNGGASVHNTALKLVKHIRLELWEDCIRLATNNLDCAWGDHPATKQAIKDQITKMEYERGTRELIADTMKEPKANESDDDFELVETHEEDFELVEEPKAGFVMVGKYGGTLDHPNISHMGSKSKDSI
ncbi:hypothetical protein [Wolbachia endosymbiont (group E) of Neria commutata]|uniref:hypothetical protein n=1 Tax=Wolbachia endosymbiont (group E) of Neria commutata TaxID=3066149 RepID=UPI0031330C1D